MKSKLVQRFFTKREDGDMNPVENRRNFLNRNNLSHKHDVLMEQVHGSEIIVVDGDYQTDKCDGLITNRTDVALFVRVADCIPVLFFDPIEKIIAVAHAGREGVFQNIVGKMIQKFQNQFGSDPQNIIVELGPSANVCCYEVGRDTNEHLNFVRNNFDGEFIFGKHIDLPGITKFQLVESGIKEENITISSVCTMCRGVDYYSFRNTGTQERFAGMISLNNI